MIKKLFAFVMVFTVVSVLYGCKNNSTETKNETVINYETIDPFEEMNAYKKDIDIISNYEAKGIFSEGLAFVSYYSDGTKYAYIDNSGKIIFYLPDGYYDGEEFNDGYAVIKRSEAPCYAVIDKSGKIVFNGEGYNALSRASEGIICAYVKEETYLGTNIRTDFLNYKGEVIGSVNDAPKSFVSSNERSERYFQFGTVPINGKFYDKQGNVVYDLNQKFSSDLDIYDYQTDNNTQFYMDGHLHRVFDRKNLKFLSVVFTNPYNMVPISVRLRDSGIGATLKDENGKEYILFNFPDGNEKKVFIDGLEYLSSSDTDLINEDYWIVQLQNGFEAVIDINGNFLFEPVKDDILYYGEGMFCLRKSKTFIDSAGTEIYSVDFVPDSWALDEEDLYHEGMRVYNKKFIDKSGTKLNEIYFKK